MSQILNKLREVDPNSSEAIKEALTPFFQQLPKHTEVNCGQWLRALQTAINRFPKYCMSQRGTVETYLASFLDCTNYYIVVESAKCAHSLQQVKPAQEKTATAKSCWRDQMSTLCSAAHSLIGALFPNSVDLHEHKSQNEQEPSSPLASALCGLSKTQGGAVNRQALLHNRLRNVFVFIQAMLVETYPVAKPIRPQSILDVIVRALSVSSNPGQNLTDAAMVKAQALRCLDALVACLGPNLIPFSPLVFRFVMQTLKWTSEHPGEESRKVRCSAYDSLSRWLTTLHTHKLAQDRAKCWEDELTLHIVGDITPTKHVVELQMTGGQPTKHLSKKARRRMANSMVQNSALATHMPGENNRVAMPEESNDEVAIAALECAEVFLTVCGIFLKPATHKRFQERLVRECHALSTYSSERALALLRALDAARKGAPPNVPPPTQYCLQIYSVHLNSTHTQIANFCSQALLDIRLHLHCSPPSLSFDLQPLPDETHSAQQKHSISQRNREALEKLLGADKVPKQTEPHIEVITISEEPEIKRRKLDSDGDKISLSSDSIEISDDDDKNEEQVEIVIETVDAEKEIPTEEIIVDPVIIENEAQSEMDVVDNKTDYIHENPTQLENSEETNQNGIEIVETEEIVIEEIDDNVATDTEPIKPINLESDNKIDSTQTETETIYGATTQMPLNVSNEEEETPLSMEVAYDYPNTGSEKVALLEKLDGDNLPSTNETDDIEITCGQDVKTPSQKKVEEKVVEEKVIEEKVVEIKVNGVNSPEKPLQNGDVSEGTGNGKDLNVEDMLADFVDEVTEDTQVTQATS